MTCFNKPISLPRISCEDLTEEKCSQKPQRTCAHVAEEDPKLSATEECVDVESEESGLYRSLASNYSSNLYNNNNSKNHTPYTSTPSKKISGSI